MTEEWRDIPDYEGKYQASSYGRIRSLDRTIIRKNGTKHNIKGRILKNREKGDRRYQVNLLGVNKAVHRLVAKTFIPNPENKEQVNHIDGNPQNNRVDNLEWCTRSENILHSFRIGLHSHKCERHNRRKLSGDDVNFILSNDNVTGVELAKRYNVTPQCIHSIRRNQNWVGDRKSMGKYKLLSFSDVTYIRENKNLGVESLSKKFNVSKVTIYNILKNKTRKTK